MTSKACVECADQGGASSDAGAAAAAGAGDGAEDEDDSGAEPQKPFKKQVPECLPKEEDLNAWSHHHTTATIDDE